MTQAINLPNIVDEVRNAFERYETALVTNDIATLDTLFWCDPRTVRYGAGENLYGYQAIAAYRAARPSKDLARTIQHSVITTFGNDYATVWMEFTRAGQDAIGRQSQCWVRRPEGWRIVAAHVSKLQA